MIKQRALSLSCETSLSVKTFFFKMKAKILSSQHGPPPRRACNARVNLTRIIFI